ncbi:hypothetical protein [Undibacterium terreum]|uniref:Uncharacterized protein n=1 Tax=Undibacterium terreum TaxID=1224302 RepID=A0A916U3G9_9BURK|nr:hypothetical protein [Undibacterium terreum]GGC58256.1 hypothetical protein GCM10011396_01380 [Undibacterium terreum]
MKANNVISIIDYRNNRAANTLERQLEQLKVCGYTELAYFIELGKVNHPLNKISHVREEPSSGLATVGRLFDNPKGNNSL